MNPSRYQYPQMVTGVSHAQAHTMLGAVAPVVALDQPIKYSGGGGYTTQQEKNQSSCISSHSERLDRARYRRETSRGVTVVRRIGTGLPSLTLPLLSMVLRLRICTDDGVAGTRIVLLAEGLRASIM
jgi:hypothetical protein